MWPRNGLGFVQCQPSTERNSVMPKSHYLSDDAWAGVADLFTVAHFRGSPRSSDRLMPDGVLQ